MNTIEDICANHEMIDCLKNAYDRGLCPFILDRGIHELRFWRDSSGRLYATEHTIVEPNAVPVEIEWESGAGWRAVGT